MLSFLAVTFFLGLVVVAVFAPFLSLLWALLGRPVALALRLIEPTADDYVVRGWNAEQDGQAADALAAYDEALRIRRWDRETEARRAGLLEQHPDLAEQADRSERERLATLGPVALLDHSEGKVTGRKLRLVAVACGRRVWHLLTDDRLRAAVEAAERLADNSLSEDEFVAVHTTTMAAVSEAGVDAEVRAAVGRMLDYSDYFLDSAVDVVDLTEATVGAVEQVAIIHCVFGLPYRKRQVNPACLTSTVLALAQGIYDEKAFDRMPILADALQDAGCSNDDILDHCRGDGPHCRGCFVIDLLLGKE